MNRENYRNEILYVLFAQKKIIGIVTLSVFCCCLLLYLFLPRKYEASGLILLRGKTMQAAPGSTIRGQERIIPVKKEDIYSEQQLLYSRELMMRVLEKTGDQQARSSEYDQQAMAFTLLSRITASVIPGTNLIDIRLTGRDPEQTVELLDTIMREYLRYRTTVFQPSGTVDFLDRRSDAIAEQLRKKEHMLIEVMARANTSDPGREIQGNLALKRDLENERHRLNGELVELRARIARLDRPDASGLRQIKAADDPLLTALLARQSQLRIEMNKLLRTYKPESQAITVLREEQKATALALKAQVGRYRSLLRGQESTILKKIEKIDSDIEELNRKNLELRRQQVAQDRIRQEIHQLEESVRNIERSREEARLKTAATADELTSFVSIAQKAQPSPGPVFPSPLLIYMGLLGGPLLGISLGFILEFLDHRFKRAVDVERVSSLPVLFSLPEK